jgi:predicted nucleic acid-binding protein
MTARFFVDTNVLVYVYSLTEVDKARRAIEILRLLVAGRLGAISTQVLAEFFSTVTQRIAVPLSVEEAYERLEYYLQKWEVINMSGTIVLEAARGVREYQFNFWDAQIWAAAKLNQIPIVLTEDFNIGASIEGVRFVNPFAPEFRVEDWLG